MQQKLCLNCKKEIIKKENKFCNRSCSASFNNQKFPKRLSEKSKKCACGKPKAPDSKQCMKCQSKEKLQIQLDRTKKDISASKNGNRKYNEIRKLANRILILEKIEKKCKVCPHNICLDVCHIKPISTFSDESKLKEINSLDNLVYLCPTHHRMFDKGLLKLE